MTSKNVAQFANVLPALAVLSAEATKFARKGKRVRMYRHDLRCLPEQGALATAIAQLVLLGVQVRVYEGSYVHTPVAHNGEIVEWQARSTPRTRDYVCVEVTL